MKKNSHSNHFVSRMGAGIALVTALGGLAMSGAPLVYADTSGTSSSTLLQPTNYAQLSNLVDIYNGLNTTLTQDGTIDAVKQFVAQVAPDPSVQGNAAAVSKAQDSWAQVLYGMNYSHLNSTQQSGVAFVQNLFAILTDYTTEATSVNQLGNAIKGAFPPNLNITGTELDSFYSSFRTALLGEIITNNTANSTNSLNMDIENALIAAVKANPVFSGDLGKYNLSIDNIPTYRANFMNQFSKAYGYSADAQQIMEDLIAATINPVFTSGSPVMGTSATLEFAPQNVGSSIDSIIKQLPSSLFTSVTANPSDALVTQNSAGGWNVQFLTSGQIILNVVLRGYNLQVPVNVAPAYTGGASTGGSTSTTTATSPTATQTGVAGQPLTVAVLGNHGIQVLANLSTDDVTSGLQVKLNAITTLPTDVTPIKNVLQAIQLSASGTSTTGSSSGGSSSSTAVDYFSKPVTVTFTLTAAPTSPISIVFWNPLTKSWQPVSNFTVNQNTITMTTSHFTTFAVVSASSVNSVNRIAGQRAMDTAIQAAESAYPDGASSVVLAFQGNKTPSPDALSAAGLAGALHAPLLLTAQNQLDPAVLQSIQALGAKTVYVLGGPHAISDAVVNALTQAGLTVVRQFQGQTLYDTSLMIDQYMYSNKLTQAQTVFIANGGTMVDAASGSPVAYQQGAPVLLVKTGQAALTADQLAFLQSAGIKNAVLLGGNYVVSPDLENRLDQTLGASNVMRLAGQTMNGTAAAIAAHYFPNATGAVLASNGTPTGSLVDALSASAFAANNNVPILLTNGDSVPTSTATFLANAKSSLHSIWVIGGKAAVSPAVDATVKGDVQTSN